MATSVASVDGEILDADLLPLDDRILIGGNFALVNGLYRPGAAVLTPNLATDRAWWGRAFNGSVLGQVRGVSYAQTKISGVDGSSFWLGGEFDRIGVQAATQRDPADVVGQKGNVWRIIGDKLGLMPEGSPHSGFVGGAYFYDATQASVAKIKAMPIQAALLTTSYAIYCGSYDRAEDILQPVGDRTAHHVTLLYDTGDVYTDFYPHAFESGGTPIAGDVTDIAVSDGPQVGEDLGGRDTQFYCICDGVTLLSKDIGLARVNLDGTLDTGFNPYWASNPGVVCVEPDPGASKVLVGGTFGLVLLEHNGDEDTSFTPPTLSDTVKSIKRTSGGAYLVGGPFGVVLVNADGSLDGGFTNAAVDTIKVLLTSSGYIYAVGPANVTKLNPDGTLA